MHLCVGCTILHLVEVHEIHQVLHNNLSYLQSGAVPLASVGSFGSNPNDDVLGVGVYPALCQLFVFHPDLFPHVSATVHIAP